MKNAIVFPGQGSQVIGMSKDLCDNFDVAKKTFDEVDQALNKNLSKIIFEGPEDLLTETENAQPAIMCASIAILRVLEKETGKGINELCDFVAGHSLGEYTALCAAGALSLGDTSKLLKARGESFSEAAKLSKGAMAVLMGATMEQAEDIVSRARQANEVCQIANDNAIGQIVLSGNEKSIDRAIEIALGMEIKRALRLPVSGAFHSELMEPAVEKMRSIIENTKIDPLKVRFIANASASEASAPDMIKKNLIGQITSRVRWRETLMLLENNGVETVAQLGPGKALSVMVVRTTPNMKSFTINNMDSLNENIGFFK